MSSVERPWHGVRIGRLNAVFRFYYWLLSQQYLERSQTEENLSLLSKAKEAAQMADAYYAYDAVYMFCVSFPLKFE